MCGLSGHAALPQAISGRGTSHALPSTASNTTTAVSTNREAKHGQTTDSRMNVGGRLGQQENSMNGNSAKKNWFGSLAQRTARMAGSSSAFLAITAITLAW